MTPARGAFVGMALPLVVAAAFGAAYGHSCGGIICKPDPVGAAILWAIWYSGVYGLPLVPPGVIIGLVLAWVITWASRFLSQGRPGPPPRAPISSLGRIPTAGKGEGTL